MRMRERKASTWRRLDARLATLAGSSTASSARGGGRQARGARARLRERLAELPPTAGRPGRRRQEIVRFAARPTSTRRSSRLARAVDTLARARRRPGACGRKLDFLLQEMNREINTIGSKVEASRVTEVVIAAKAELERMREQVQNVE